MDSSWAERAARWALHALVVLPGVVVAGVLTVAASFTPEAIARGDHFAWSGLVREPCVGCSMCGMSRALAAFAHGDFAAAWRLHPGVFAVAPLLTALVFLSVWATIRLVYSPVRFFRERFESKPADQEAVRA